LSRAIARLGVPVRGGDATRPVCGRHSRLKTSRFGNLFRMTELLLAAE
jgi:hypothetical protein